MLITIINNHSPLKPSSQKNTIILGVHNFIFHLTSYLTKKNISILIKGHPISILQNILWNQFYHHTLLKDINKILTNSSSSDNIYLKINNITYRLSECLQWQNYQKLKQQLLKHPTIYIQSFTQQGQIKLFTIDLTQTKLKKIDIIFQYQRENISNSSSIRKSIRHHNHNNISSLSKTNNKSDTIKNQVTTKSLFQIYKSKQKQDNNITKFLTQKKRNQTKPKKSIKYQQTQNKNPSQIKTQKQPKIISSQKQNCQLSSLSNNTFNNNIMNKTQKTQSKSIKQTININHTSKKQQCIANILNKKQSKINQYKQAMESLSKQFQSKLENIQQTHQQQVITIKQQVQDILNAYKHKNKQLRKQNKSLLQQNHQLQQTILIIKQSMKNLQQKQHLLQNNNHEYSLKLQNIQKNNSILNQQILHYQLTSNQKDKQIYHFKMKYQRLLGTLRSAAQTQKQPIF